MRALARRLRPMAAAVTLAAVLWRLGTGPFFDGIRAVDDRALLAALTIGLVTTVSCAWRWTIVARGLGARLSLSSAVAAYYRSTFLNLTLPGGVVGDVHRAVRHGRDVHDVGRAVRAVAWERAAGQVVQAALTVAVLLVMPSPVRSAMPLAAAGVGALLLAVLLVARAGSGRSWLARARYAIATDLRAGLLRLEALPAVVGASMLVVAGHAATFLVAARAAGVDASASRLLPLFLLVLLAAALPSIAGWGPREGATAWVFGASGLGADRGAATAVVYGVMVLAASLPGALVLLAGWLPRTQRVRVVRARGAADA